MVDTNPITEELLTVQEAAALLGVHPNTVRNRIKSGQYTAEWAPSSHGPRQMIPRVQVVCDPSLDPVAVGEAANGVSMQLALREQQEAALQRVLLPFLDRLESVVRENGRLQEANNRLEAERERLQQELAERDAPPAATVAEGATSKPAPVHASWWRRLLYGANA